MQLKKWSILSAAALMSMVGCGTDDDNTATSSETVSIASEIKAGESAPVEGKITSGNTVDELTVEVVYTTHPSVEDIGVSVKNLPAAGTKTIEFETTEVVTTAEACNGDYTLSYKYVGSSSTGGKDLKFSVVDGVDCTPADATPLGEAKTGVIYNVKGPAKGAFDLKAGEGVGAAGDVAIKDLMDMSVAATDDDLFSKELTSGNGAMFKKVDLDYATATAEEVTAAATELSAKSGVLASGDVVIVKLSADRDGALILLEATTVTDDAVGDNAGKIEFSYKMVPAAE